MSAPLDREYWKECWPDSLLIVLRDFMQKGDSQGILGLSSLAVCHRKSTDYEAAVCALVRETMLSFDESKKIKDDLQQHEVQYREMGLYDVREKRAEQLGMGLVPLARLEKTVKGYKALAGEIYRELEQNGFVRIETQTIRNGEVKWIGFTGDWGALIEGIRTQGASSEMFASCLAVLLCMAVRKIGTTTILPMARCVIEATSNGGKITYEELVQHYQNVKILNIILEREREKSEALRVFPTDDGNKLILSQNTAYAVEVWQSRANQLARARGLGV
jgi:hypothetical protein